MEKRLAALKRDRGGFTLVELIVVLIILAILAALLIPALTGYINKAKETQIIAETRQAVMAAQTLWDEKYAEDGEQDDGALVESIGDAVKDLAEVSGEILSITANDGKITGMEYKSGDKTCTFTRSDDTTPIYSVN